MSKKHVNLAITLLLGAGSLFLALPSRAQTNTLNFMVGLDTSSLEALPDSFAVDFQLNDGSGTGDANNTAVITDVNFLGGSASGSPTLVGGAVGNLTQAPTLTLTDSNSLLNEFTQDFTPGSQICFSVALTTNVDAGPNPDQFSFAVLDNGVEIPTLGPGDAFVVVNIDSASPTVLRYGTDPARTTLDIAAPSDTCAAVPEASTLGSFLGGCALLLFLGAWGRWNSARCLRT